MHAIVGCPNDPRAIAPKRGTKTAGRDGVQEDEKIDSLPTDSSFSVEFPAHNTNSWSLGGTQSSASPRWGQVRESRLAEVWLKVDATGVKVARTL